MTYRSILPVLGNESQFHYWMYWSTQYISIWTPSFVNIQTEWVTRLWHDVFKRQFTNRTTTTMTAMPLSINMRTFTPQQN